MIENFGRNLAELRKKHNMKQSELAEKLGVSTQIISKIELGKSYPTFANLEKISQIFNASPIQLFGTNKEKAVSDIPIILDRIDKYNNIVLNFLNIMDFITCIEDKNTETSKTFYDLYAFFNKRRASDSEGEPITDKNGDFIYEPSYYEELIRVFEDFPKLSEEINAFFNKRLVFDSWGEPIIGKNGDFIYASSYYEQLKNLLANDNLYRLMDMVQSINLKKIDEAYEKIRYIQENKV